MYFILNYGVVIILEIAFCNILFNFCSQKYISIADFVFSITVLFFAKEGAGCKLLSAKEMFAPVTLTFEKGLGQKFRQPTGTGINFSLFEESELTKIGDPEEVYPLAVKAETSAEAQIDGNKVSTNSLITQAVFEKKDQGEYHVKVSKQILWVEDMRYELQEIYGIGNSVENDFDGNDPGKECVICLSEASDTTVLPCRHMVKLVPFIHKFSFNSLYLFTCSRIMNRG